MNQEWVALGLVGGVAATCAYWYLQFRKVLPLEKRLRFMDGFSGKSSVFSQEMLRAHLLPASPQTFADSIQYAVDRFLAHYRGYQLFIWVKRASVGMFAASDGELVCRTGMLESMEPKDLALPEEVWKRLFESSGAREWRDVPEPLSRAFGARGLRAVRGVPWGSPGKIWGVLVVLEERMTLPDSGGWLDGLKILAAYLASLSERTSQFWEINRAREQLEGGLNVTMARLDETNLKLIERAKELNTLEEVTDAISAHPDRSEILKSIVSILARTLRADLCAFLLLDESTAELVTQPGAYGVLGDEGSLYRISLKNEDASSVSVFLTGKPFITGDMQNDPHVIPQFARLWKCHSLIVVPLSVEGRRIGVMRVGSFKRDSFTPDHLKLVRLIAEETAVLVESVTLSEKLAETNRELAELHRMKDDFVSTVSHEFKTPLTSIKGFISVLLDEEAGPLTQEQKRFLKIIESSSERLGALVNDMLDMSRLERGVEMALESAELEKIARASVENQRCTADNRGIRLVLEAPPLLPPARGNDEWLRHVFDNLISNALKFTPDHGEVTVTLAQKGDCLKVTVADTGIGIPENDREKIFEKFYRATNRHSIKAGGTGLGLAICKSIIDKHGGRIWFDTEEEKGSRFHFVVSVEEKSAALEARQEAGGS